MKGGKNSSKQEHEEGLSISEWLSRVRRANPPASPARAALELNRLTH